MANDDETPFPSAKEDAILHRFKKTQALEAIIDSAPPELRLLPGQWRIVENMLSRAYEDGRAQASDPRA